MRPYEAMFILDTSLEEAEVQAVINRSTTTIESRGGTVNRVEKWGKRRLAYEIAKRPEGYYVLLTATSEPPAVAELERALRLADEVIRHKIVRIPDHAGGRVLPPSAVEEITAAGSRPDRERSRSSMGRKSR